MANTDSLQSMADFLWDFLTDEPPSLEEQQEQVTQRVVDALEEAGFRGVSNEELVEALEGVSNRLCEQQEADLADLSSEMNLNLQNVSVDLSASLTQDFEAGLNGLRVEQIEPLKAAIASQPAPVIHRHVTQVTNIDDRQVVNNRNVVHEGGNLNQNIVQGDDGAVVAGGNIQDSAVNTGIVDGVQAGGDVDVDDSIIGDGNTTIEDSDVDALAIGGDATSIDVNSSPPAPTPEEEAIDEAPLPEPPPEETFEAAEAAADADAAALEAELDA